MLVSGIKSKPVYEALRADPGGRYHLLIGFGPGCAALQRVIDELDGLAHGSENTRMLIVAEPGDPAAGRLQRAGSGGCHAYATVDELLSGCRSLLRQSLMGTRLYVAGPESFIGRVLQIALEFNLNKDEIRAEELGTLARRAFCVHCHGITEDVRTNIVRCAGCDRWLLVRDHYSRRLAAYMAVMADAEAPGELPPVREVYP